MFHLNKALLNVSVLMLILNPIVAHAGSDAQSRTDNQLHTQVQQLKTQITDANDRIAALETAKNTVNQNINVSHNSLDTAARRTANGHGR